MLKETVTFPTVTVMATAAANDVALEGPENYHS
jgi:hypothetical protein